MGDNDIQIEFEGSEFVTMRVVNVKSKRILARTIRVSDGCECFVKILSGSEVEQAKLATEWSLLQRIGARDGIAQGLGLLKTSLGLGLVTKYVSGLPLSQCQLFSNPTKISRQDLMQFCRLAIGTCEALGWIHKAGIMHKDLSESNILYDPDTGQVTIIDFGLASLADTVPQAAVGTWKYISPEQTGRTSLPIDCRADLYSLGAVLYEVAAGRPLFSSNDVLGVIHQHLTAEPVPLNEVRPGIPSMLSQVVLKLIEKHPNHRYQGAWGARFDFRECLLQLERSNSTEIDMFALGTNDVPNSFRRPTTLYARDDTMHALRQSLSEVTTTSSLHLVLLSGPSGSGKTSVAEALHNEIQRKDVVWLGSKLDQYTRVPYACFLPMFDQFVDRCLTLDCHDFITFQARLLAKLNGYGQLLINSFPMLHLILGDQKPLSEMTPADEKKKFFQVCREFFSSSFCQINAPLNEQSDTVVLFFDDLQWADSSSLILLQSLCELKDLPILVLCASRTEHADSSQVYTETMEKITALGTPTTKLAINNLSHPDIVSLLSESFQGRYKSSMVADFSTHLLNRTLGNPFFLIQLLDALHAQKAVQYERTAEGGEWVWHPGLVMTDNVLQLLAEKLKMISTRSQEILRMAALVGSTFDLDTMQAMTQIPLEDIQTDIDLLVSLGLIIANAVVEQKARSDDDSSGRSKRNALNARTYRFLHDRVQQAASNLFDNEEERARAHYALGKKMWEQKTSSSSYSFSTLSSSSSSYSTSSFSPTSSTFSQQEDYQRLFEIANHMLEGIRFIEKSEEYEMCELFLCAGRHAREGMSGVYAQKYLLAILDLLSPSEENWELHTEFLRECHFELHQASFQLCQTQQARIYLETVLEHSATKVEKAEVLDKLAAVAVSSDDNVQAVKLCLENLSMFGICFPSENLQTALKEEYLLFRENLREQKIEDLKSLFDLPRVDTPEKECIARAFKTILPSLYLTNPILNRLVASVCVNWSIKNGTSPDFVYLYANFAMILLWVFGDYDDAHSLAVACIEPNLKQADKADLRYSCLVVGTLVFNWTQSHIEADAVLERGHRISNAFGDYVYCSFFSFCRAIQLYSRPTLLIDMNFYQEMMDNNQKYGAGNVNAKCTITAMMLGNLCLQGKSKHPFSLEVEEVVDDLQGWLAENRAEDRCVCLVTFHIYQALVLFVMFDAKGAYDSLEQIRSFVEFMPSLIINSTFQFFTALTRLQLIAPSHSGPCRERPIQPEPCSDEEAREYLIVVDQCLCTLAQWAKRGPHTYYQMLLMVFAERRRVFRARPSVVKFNPRQFTSAELEELDRHEVYRRAITSASEDGNNHHLALAHELLMRYWRSEEETDYAQIHWRGAMVAYSSWGARGKLKLLQAEFNHANLARMLDPQLSPASSDSTLVLQEKQTIFAASRLISSEIVLEKLLLKLMRVIAEYVGATFGLLLSYENGQWKEECACCSCGERKGLPTSILNLVYNKLEVVVLSDAATHEIHHRDPYVAAYKPKSVLCVPIVLHGEFMNAIYLENNGFEGTFTKSLSEVAEILASQAATAIQNGRLYRKLNDYNRSLEEQVKERTVQLSTAREHADQANKAKSTFLASMSHEIRTPMNGIMASMELLKMTRLTDEQTELADVVITCADALLVLINDILDLSKIEADKLELESIWFGLDRCLESVLDILAPKVFPKGLDIAFQTWGTEDEKLEVTSKGQTHTFFPNVPKVILGDYTRFRQIVLNLCSNAVKFTLAGEVIVRVWWRPLEDAKATADQSLELYVSVRDTGIGVPTSRLPLLFKAFSQVENSTTRKFGGTGLGLAICQPLVQLMGGNIWVDSEVGKGSNFQFTMITSSRQDTSTVQCVNTLADEPRPILRPGMRVLLVQDSSVCAEILKASLVQIGCLALRVPVSQGLEILQTEQFDACLIDWAPKYDVQPNVVSGEEELHAAPRVKYGEILIESFRAWEGTQNRAKRLPIVLSSYDRQHKINSLIDGFVAKPTKQRHVLKILDALSRAIEPIIRLHLTQSNSNIVPSSALRLLLAEDNKINVRMATKMVESVGYKMTIVNNGKQAVDQVKAWHEEGTPCQAILMDIQMPEMDGLEATRMIRNSDIPISEQPYIIALTANAMASDRLACFQAGMNDYLSKPMNRQDLAKALRSAARAKNVFVSELDASCAP